MEDESWRLDGLRMNAVHTDGNGVIDERTIFCFSQTGSRVKAEYQGGEIDQGYLIGVVQGATLEFRYCQIDRQGQLDGGHSHCELRRSGGLVEIVEHFDWGSRPGGGTNVIRQLE